jgi:hypothetical protein
MRDVHPILMIVSAAARTMWITRPTPSPEKIMRTAVDPRLPGMLLVLYLERVDRLVE